MLVRSRCGLIEYKVGDSVVATYEASVVCGVVSDSVLICPAIYASCATH